MSETPSYEPEPIDNSFDKETQAGKNILHREKKLAIFKEIQSIEESMDGNTAEENKITQRHLDKLYSMLTPNKISHSESGGTINGEEVEPTQEVLDMMGGINDEMGEMGESIGDMVSEMGDAMSEMMSGLTDQIKDIKANEILDIGINMFGNLSSEMIEKMNELQDKTAEIEEIAPGFTENVEGIHLELETVLDLEGDGIDQKKIKKDLKGEFYTFIFQFDDWSDEKTVKQAVGKYLETINSILAKNGIDKLDIKVLD